MPFLANPTYEPALNTIAVITNGNPATVTTVANHDYISGTIVRLLIPLGFGMLQADELFGTITVTGLTTFTIDIDTSDFDAFAIPVLPPLSLQAAQVSPIGEINELLTSATANIL